MSSPRPWRCFCCPVRYKEDLRVFSTSVEVFLIRFCTLRNALRLLHVRGGVSEPHRVKARLRRSSPRPWRCFPQCGIAKRMTPVFSTSVEVFLALILLVLFIHRLLHVRGGVSHVALVSRARCGSSPRPWRCFRENAAHASAHNVFSTSVEVFLGRCLPIWVSRRLLH